MVKDPEATFRRLFGEEFAKAYEEQLKRLKAERRARPRARGHSTLDRPTLGAPFPSSGID